MEQGVRDTKKAMKLFNWDELSNEEFYKAFEGVAGATGTVTGIPLKQGLTTAKGVTDILDGDYDKGFAEVMGLTSAKAEKVAEGDKKRRR